ncbi:GNAT family N-acetyltransferase [Aquimarina pacifica]|uniref:GNAT family N-acetyltransferase n=1 Tax=Aquimarina pacifica TaxID=1296415 RepID=UPI00047235A6|nr:GNAT family N-acetyltransferase [Aquimarina pacifica]
MIKLLRTDSKHQDFISLVVDLDKYLAVTDGEDHAFYDQFNKIGAIKYVVIAYENDVAVGCGAIKEMNSDSMEVKRMYTNPQFRGKGIASKVLSELEKWTAELRYKKCVLETGKKQVEAIQLYKKQGYTLIDNYGQYVGVENSLCFEKRVKN